MNKITRENTDQGEVIRIPIKAGDNIYIPVDVDNGIMLRLNVEAIGISVYAKTNAEGKFEHLQNIDLLNLGETIFATPDDASDFMRKKFWEKRA